MIPVSISLIKVYVMQVLFVYFLSKLMPQILMVWIHFFFFFLKKGMILLLFWRNQDRIILKHVFYFWESCLIFSLTLITRKLHFVVICHLWTVSFFHFRPFKQKDWWKTFSCKLIKPHNLVSKWLLYRSCRIWKTGWYP